MDINYALPVIKEVMEDPKVRRLAGTITESKSLFICLGPQSRKRVMEKVLANPTLSLACPIFLPSKSAYGNKRSSIGMCASLHETKQSNSNVKLPKIAS
jgi:hypothetical protein